MWEILRTFARAVHMLAHTVDAYANERYIRTATQWDNVRRLVNMLDYHPAPPASAQTYVALIAKQDEQAIGTVEQGCAIKNKPQDGSTPLIFESLADIEVDHRLNALRAPDYNRSPDKIWLSGAFFNFEPALMPEGISVGDYAVLTDHIKAIAVTIEAINSHSLTLKKIDKEFTSGYLNLADLTLTTANDWHESPKLNGTGVIQVDQIDTVKINDVLAFYHSGSYRVRRVIAINSERVELDNTDNVGTSENFYLTSASKPQNTEYGHDFVYPKDRKSSKVWLDDGNLSARSPSVQRADPDDASSAVLHDKLGGHLAANSISCQLGRKKCSRLNRSHPMPWSFPVPPKA